MRQATETRTSPGEKSVKDIKRATRKHYSSEEKIRIVLDGLRGEDSIAELCRREGISQGIYYKWSKDFMEAGKRRLAGDTIRAATTDEVKDLRREARDLKETELSPRERAVTFTDQESYFVSETSVYRVLKAHDLITSPAFIVIKAASEFQDKTTAINPLWQTDFT